MELPEATDIKKIRALLQEVKNDAKHVEWQTAAYVDFEHAFRKNEKRIWLLLYFVIGLIISMFADTIYNHYRYRQLTKEDGNRKRD